MNRERVKQKQIQYCPKFDTHYAPTGEWIESQCADPGCTYCTSRPEVHPKNCKVCLKKTTLTLSKNADGFYKPVTLTVNLKV